jgi:guanine deaminase
MAFPEESRYSDLMYAKRAYDYFVEDLYIGATTRAAVFATKHTDATLELMDMLEETGLVSCVGKVNMDRNVPGYYVESTESSISETRRWLDEAEGRYERTYPILTPRFTPACTRELMNALGDLAAEYGGLPVQSHISENPAECEWVKELEKDCASYAETYDRAGLFGTRGGLHHASCRVFPCCELSL